MNPLTVETETNNAFTLRAGGRAMTMQLEEGFQAPSVRQILETKVPDSNPDRVNVNVTRTTNGTVETVRENSDYRPKAGDVVFVTNKIGNGS